MQTISAIFDGNYFKPMEPIPVEGKYDLVWSYMSDLER
jgi:hypothetical protein